LADSRHSPKPHKDTPQKGRRNAERAEEEEEPSLYGPGTNQGLFLRRDSQKTFDLPELL
jgi:hypothetical protein